MGAAWEQRALCGVLQAVKVAGGPRDGLETNRESTNLSPWHWGQQEDRDHERGAGRQAERA